VGCVLRRSKEQRGKKGERKKEGRKEGKRKAKNTMAFIITFLRRKRCKSNKTCTWHIC
jgi:hypothetical protein